MMEKLRENWKMLAVIGLEVLVLLVLISCFLLPYLLAGSSMPAEGEFVIVQNADGSLELSWPQAQKADSYCLEFFLPDTSERVYRDYVTGGSCILPQLPTDRELTMMLHPAVEYKVFGMERKRLGSRPLSVTACFAPPAVKDLRWKTDGDSRTMNAFFSLEDRDLCRCSLTAADGSQTLLSQSSGPGLTLRFGETGDLPMPEIGEIYELSFQACRSLPGLRFYGYPTQISLQLEHLLGRFLDLKSAAGPDNTFTLTWEETKGGHYEVQIREGDSWRTIASLPIGTLSYTTPSLPPCRELECRVAAVGGQTMSGSSYAALSEEILLKTSASPLYATVWPVKDLVTYRDSAMTDEVGKVTAGTALCVAEEKGNAFAVRIGSQIRYIDSSCCLINLPDYLGPLCSYRITNSSQSRYMVHEFGIPNVTGQVVKGYEFVRQQDGSYLVPLLYPTARKLLEAANIASQMGYTLKIYDAFRPVTATREIYNRTLEILDCEIPDYTYTGVPLEELNLPRPEEDSVLTYSQVMTLGSYGLNAFLAPGGSMHNLGIALDLTLEDRHSGQEVPMQTGIHDLSAYSVVNRNNSYAKTLADIMKAAGFGPLVSEWWHFQDNETRQQLSPPALYNGIDGEGWKTNGLGWRYRYRDGTYAADAELTLGGTLCVFDENGYLME